MKAHIDGKPRPRSREDDNQLPDESKQQGMP